MLTSVIELLRECKALQTLPKQTQHDEWFARWESTYAKCKRAHIAEITDRRVIQDILDTVQPLNEMATEAMKVNILRDRSLQH